MVKNNSFVILGCKHCGKSTHGKALAAKLGIDFFDLDAVIEKMTGTPVRQYFNEKGLTDFLMAEELACKKIVSFLNKKNREMVISTGGGICDNPPALEHLRVCKSFVYLKMDVKDSVDRVMSGIEEIGDGKFKNLPAYVQCKKPKTLEGVREILTDIFRQRSETYEKIADIIVDIKNAPIEENFDSIIRAISSC